MERNKKVGMLKNSGWLLPRVLNTFKIGRIEEENSPTQIFDSNLLLSLLPLTRESNSKSKKTFEKVSAMRKRKLANYEIFGDYFFFLVHSISICQLRGRESEGRKKECLLKTFPRSFKIGRIKGEKSSIGIFDSNLLLSLLPPYIT